MHSIVMIYLSILLGVPIYIFVQWYSIIALSNHRHTYMYIVCIYIYTYIYIYPCPTCWTPKNVVKSRTPSAAAHGGGWGHGDKLGDISRKNDGFYVGFRMVSGWFRHPEIYRLWDECGIFEEIPSNKWCFCWHVHVLSTQYSKMTSGSNYPTDKHP